MNRLLRALVLAALVVAVAACAARAQPGGDEQGSMNPPSTPETATPETAPSDGQEFVFSANGLLVKQTIKRWTEDAPDEKCKRDVVFLIDNSGSMTAHRVRMFTALNVVITTLREKGHGRVSTVVFSDSPKTFGPPKATSRNKNAVATTACAFCWKQSNLEQQPFPDPNKVRGGTLTDLAAGMDYAINIMRNDIAGKGPAPDGPRANPKRPYKLVMLSDLLNTKGVSSPTSSAFRRFQDKMFSTFCSEDWQKYFVRASDGVSYNIKPKHKGKVSEVCKAAIAEMHYYLWTQQSARTKDMSLFLKKVKSDNLSGVNALNKAWEETAVANWRKFAKKSTSKRTQVAMYDLFTGQAKLGGAGYHAKATVIVNNDEVIHTAKWTQMELIKEILGDCEPLEYEQSIVTVDVEPAELPTLKVDIDPLVRHFANAKTQIDPNYENSLGKDEVGFISEPLEKFRDDITELKDTLDSYVENLTKQLDDFKTAAETNRELQQKLGTVQAKVDQAIAKANEAARTALARAGDQVKFAHAFIGGYASTAGFDPVRNKKLSIDRALSAYCMTEAAYNEAGISDFYIVFGTFGHKWHCHAILDLIGTPEKSCADTKAVTAAARAWAAAGEDAEAVQEREHTLLQLEDEARKAEVHFQQASATDAGFTGDCCIAHGGASCAVYSLRKCSPVTFSTALCEDKAKWQTNWTEQNRADFAAELEKSAAVLAAIAKETESTVNAVPTF